MGQCSVFMQISANLDASLGSRISLDGNYSLEFAHATARRGRGAVEPAKRLLKSCFDPLIMDNGLDLIDMMCSCYESPEDTVEEAVQYNFSTFRVAVLRKGPICVSAAVFRVFGAAFAEMPFVATKDGYRREGNLKRLLKAMESRLAGLGVRRLVVQSVRVLLPMWLGSLGFMPLTLAEADAVDDLLVSPDPDSAQLVKKSLLPGPEHAAGSAAAAPEITSSAVITASVPAALATRLQAAAPSKTPQQQPTEQQSPLISTAGAQAAERPASPSQKEQSREEEAPADASVTAQANESSPLPDLGKGWTKLKRPRPSGRADFEYVSPSGRIFRSKKQAQAHADVLAGKQPAAEPAVKTDNAEAGTGERSGQTGKTIISEGAPKRSGGAMLPPAPRAPKRGTAHAIAGVPLLPAGMQTQCQARQLDSAMAKCIAEAVQHYSKHAAEEALSREHDMQDQIKRLSEENQQLKEAIQARCSPDVIKNCGPSPMRQSQPLAGVCTLLEAVIQRVTGSGQ
ncbi:hypothetical protein CVIRNUC_007718 [Coccomyxa viridis]|uniref:MBD domain-containing protein n=1 Tax=Coccomyxa viridis TaxID=1274662 RepID=A0AAV1IAX2_9CHLO|nr:hypothetical protein CVIRNUC_007718 [Coccomyxa viridis]